MEHPHIEPEHSRLPGADDPIQVLKHDHREVEQHFAAFEKGRDQEKKQEYHEVGEELQNHMKLEEEFFYPAVRAKIKDPALVDEGIKEHNEVKRMLRETSKMKPSDKEMTNRVMEIKKVVQHHVKEEEEKMFPEVKKAMKQDELSQLGQKMMVRKQEMERK